MKNTLFFLFLVFLFAQHCAAQDTLLLEGNYTGENLYIQNPAGEKPGSFCTKKVLVNGAEVAFEAASAFEIELKFLSMGQRLVVKIIHEAGCAPKVLSPQLHCRPVCVYKIFSIGILGDSMLTWTSAEQGGKFYYTVEQFRWNKWVKCGDTISISGSDTATYNFNIKRSLHSGENQFRVKVADYSKAPVKSSVVNVMAAEQKFTMHSRCNGEILFEQNTRWELYDHDGNMISKGYGNRIKLTGLKQNLYYLNYDNKTAEFMVY